ncbi:MAG: ABC-2 transporter permease [Planctomycetota bacterium]
MLREAMRFDLLLNDKALLVNWLIFAAMLFFVAHNDDVPVGEYAIVGALMFSFGSLAIVAREDKFKTALLICSLPIPRRTVVLGRYLIALISGVGGIALATGITLLPSARILSEGASPLAVLGNGALATGIGLSLILPFTIRFGLVGIMVFLVVMQVLGFLVLMVWRRLDSQVRLKDLFQSAFGWIGEIQAALDPVVFGAAVTLLVLLLLAASYRISARIYERREL